VVILPIPYEATTTYRRGCKNGPDAILEASHQVEYYDEELTGKLVVTYIPHAGYATLEEMLQITSRNGVPLKTGSLIALGGT